MSTYRRSTPTVHRSHPEVKGYNPRKLVRGLRCASSLNRLSTPKKATTQEGLKTMDDTYQINVAKTEFREAYNRRDVDQLLSVFEDEGFTDMSEGRPNLYGQEARLELRKRSTELFGEYSVRLAVIIND